MMHEPRPDNWASSSDYLEARAYIPSVTEVTPEFDLGPEEAGEYIRLNFPDLEIESIVPFREGLRNRTFLVNGNMMFRFPLSPRGAATIDLEVAMLPELASIISLSIPNPKYVGRAAKRVKFLGYEMVPGEDLEPEFIKNPDGALKTHLAEGIARFFREIHSFGVDRAKELGVPERNLQGRYRGQLERNREILYPVLRSVYPDEAPRLEETIEQRFTDYFGDPRNFDYTSTLCHGDLASEHILYSSETDQLTGIIDFGGIEISDPDYDLWRPYFNYGPEFFLEILKFYPHPDHELLLRKINFYLAAQVLRRLTRSIMMNDKLLPQRLEVLRNWVIEGKKNLRRPHRIDVEQGED